MQTKPFVWRAALAAVFVGLATVAWAALADLDPYDQSGVPLEVQPTDATLNKIVLVAGHQSHGPGEHEFFAGCAVLMKLLQQTPGVFPVMARDGWPKDPKAISRTPRRWCFYMDGGGGHPASSSRHIGGAAKADGRRVGFVNLHYAVEYPKSQSRPRSCGWLGGYYETGFSTNPTGRPISSRCRNTRSRAASSRFRSRTSGTSTSASTPEPKRRDADPQGDAAGLRARHAGREEVPRPRGDHGLGLRPRQGRPVVRLHGRPLPRQLGRREFPPAGGQRHPVVGQDRRAQGRRQGGSRPGRAEQEPR